MISPKEIICFIILLTCLSNIYINIEHIKSQNPKVSPILINKDGGKRSVGFCAHRHAAPKNSPPDCFLNGCFDYHSIIQKKSAKRHSFLNGGDGGNRNRVLKHILMAFSVCSLLFKDSPHKTTADSLFAAVGSVT